jgi:hypothetical protein
VNDPEVDPQRGGQKKMEDNPLPGRRHEEEDVITTPFFLVE